MSAVHDLVRCSLFSEQTLMACRKGEHGPTQILVIVDVVHYLAKSSLISEHLLACYLRSFRP